MDIQRIIKVKKNTEIKLTMTTHNSLSLGLYHILDLLQNK